MATDSRTKRDGKYIALIGTVEPKKKLVRLNKDIAIKLLTQGAQPSDTVLNLFKKHGIWSEYLKVKPQHIKVVKKTSSVKSTPAKPA